MGKYTPDMECPECGETYSGIDQRERLDFRAEHRERHDRFISGDDFSRKVRAVVDCDFCRDDAVTTVVEGDNVFCSMQCQMRYRIKGGSTD